MWLSNRGVESPAGPLTRGDFDPSFRLGTDQVSEQNPSPSPQFASQGRQESLVWTGGFQEIHIALSQGAQVISMTDPSIQVLR